MKPSLKNDLKTIEIPFDLFTGLSLVTQEMNNKGFKYSHLTNEGVPSLTFKSKKLKENIIINIESETLLIKQFLMKGTTRKLKVLYIVKPTERTFKLV